ncbi:MAG: toxin-antitoxin system HicB family antitoxin [Oscillospiraceae bacterium]|nr:toxin-antitoxin system HicB family antitoxin [Oscillospiraceae bacterium]
MYKGSFNVRIEPELHRAVALFAASHSITLNAAVEDAVREYLKTQSSSNA